MIRALRVVPGAGALALALMLLRSSPVPAVEAGGQSEMVIHKQGTRLYHRPGCPVVADTKGVLALTRTQAESRGYKPHPECEAASPDAAGPDGKGKPAPPETVYLDGSRYYHRKTCAKLEGKAFATPDGKRDGIKSASLEVAGKSHWPCPTCKPPIRKRSADRQDR